MTNGEIADILEAIADTAGGNPWRARAYARAARVIARHPVPVATLGADELRELPGIGAELARRVVEIVAGGRAPTVDGGGGTRPRRRRAPEGALRLTEALRLVPGLVEYVRGAPGVRAVEAVGAYRRRAERLETIELVAATDDATATLARFAAHAGLEDARVEGTRARGRLRRAVPVELWVVPPAGWGTALVVGTGSRGHAEAILALAPGPHADEAEVYRAAGMPWIPPELREDGSELAAALDDALPALLEAGDIRGDLQMHTEWSDGNSTIARMAAACRKRGYEYLAITDHSGSLTIAGGLTPDELEEQWREIDAVRAADPGIALLRSMEVDVLPDGTLDLPDAHLAALDCVLVAVHVQQKLSRAEQTRRILRAIEHPAVDILGHPTGKRGRRPSYDVDLDAVLRRCAELDVAVELDCSPDRSDLSAENVRRALDLGCTIVIDTDAHSQGELDHMGYGVSQARRAWTESGRVLNARGWPAFRRWLGRRGRRVSVA